MEEAAVLDERLWTWPFKNHELYQSTLFGDSEVVRIMCYAEPAYPCAPRCNRTGVSVVQKVVVPLVSRPRLEIIFDLVTNAKVFHVIITALHFPKQVK